MPTGPDVPYDYAIDSLARLAYGRMWGTVTGDDMLALVTAVHDDPRWENGFDAIWDCSRVLTHVVDISEVGPLIDEEAASGDGRDALIESPRLAEVALAQLLAAFALRRGKQVTVHVSVDDALDALGRDTLPAPLDELRVTEPA